MSCEAAPPSYIQRYSNYYVLNHSVLVSLSLLRFPLFIVQQIAELICVGRAHRNDDDGPFDVMYSRYSQARFTPRNHFKPNAYWICYMVRWSIAVSLPWQTQSPVSPLPWSMFRNRWGSQKTQPCCCSFAGHRENKKRPGFMMKKVIVISVEKTMRKWERERERESCSYTTLSGLFLSKHREAKKSSMHL